MSPRESLPPLAERPDLAALASPWPTSTPPASAPPCQIGDAWKWFLSEKLAQRTEAATLCPGCEVLDLCAEAGRHEPAGVWGGVDRVKRPTTRRPAAGGGAS